MKATRTTCSAPRRSLTLNPRASQTALFAFIVPTLNIPIKIPVAVRTAADYGLRFTVSRHHPVTPLAGANLTFWGFPAEASHDAERFPKGAPGEPSGLPGFANTSCLGDAVPSSIPVHPLTDNPTTCTGQPLITTLEVQTYQDPEHLSEAKPNIQRRPAAIWRSLTRSSTQARPQTKPIHPRAQHRVERSPVPRLRRLSLGDQIGDRHPSAEGFTINPDAADGQTACTDAQANFGSEGPAECPNSSKIGTFQIETQALNGPLEGAVYIGEPKPGNQYRLFLIASGFGINAKLVGSFKPDPDTGQLTAYFENLPQAPFEDFQLHLFSSERGLMATPISLHDLHDRTPTSTLGTRRLPNSNRARSSVSNPVPTAPSARAKSVPSTRP